MSRFEAMQAHPAGRGVPFTRMSRLIDEALDQQAMDVANRARVEAEEFAGGSLSEPIYDEVFERSVWDDVGYAFKVTCVVAGCLLLLTMFVLFWMGWGA